VVDGQVYAQPLYVSNLDLGGAVGVRNVVFIATENNWVYAFDADKPGAGNNGAKLWQVNLGTAAAHGNGSCGDLDPNVGITGTPVIDLATKTIYHGGEDQHRRNLRQQAVRDEPDRRVQQGHAGNRRRNLRQDRGRGPPPSMPNST